MYLDNFLVTFFTSPFNELSCWDCPSTWLTNHSPSVLWHCWLGHLTHKLVPEMTYNVLSLMLNPTVPYHTICPSVCLFVCYQTCEHRVLKTNEPILMPVGTSGKWPTFWIRRSKVKAKRPQTFLSARYLKNCPTNCNQTWQARIMVFAHWMEKVEGQGHTRLKIDLEAWHRHRSWPQGWAALG